MYLAKQFEFTNNDVFLSCHRKLNGAASTDTLACWIWDTLEASGTDEGSCILVPNLVPVSFFLYMTGFMGFKNVNCRIYEMLYVTVFRILFIPAE